MASNFLTVRRASSSPKLSRKRNLFLKMFKRSKVPMRGEVRWPKKLYDCFFPRPSSSRLRFEWAPTAVFITRWRERRRPPSAVDAMNDWKCSFFSYPSGVEPVVESTPSCSTYIFRFLDRNSDWKWMGEVVRGVIVTFPRRNTVATTFYEFQEKLTHWNLRRRPMQSIVSRYTWISSLKISRNVRTCSTIVL